MCLDGELSVERIIEGIAQARGMGFKAHREIVPNPPKKKAPKMPYYTAEMFFRGKDLYSFPAPRKDPRFEKSKWGKSIDAYLKELEEKIERDKAEEKRKASRNE